jgi:hypothetical protein
MVSVAACPHSGQVMVDLTLTAMPAILASETERSAVADLVFGDDEAPRGRAPADVGHFMGRASRLVDRMGESVLTCSSE